MMETYLISDKGTMNITPFIDSITLSGEYRSCCRMLDFGLIQNPNDKNIPIISIFLGDNIRLVENGKIMFYGVVWNKDKSTDGKTIDINCKDFGIYLLKNSYSYKFKNMTADNIARKICNDFGIKVGTLASTGVRISRNFINTELYNIIMSAYTVSNDKKYFCIFTENKLNILEKGTLINKNIESGSNLLTSSVSESLDNVVNRVNIFNHENKLIKKVENSELIKLYGLLTDYIKLQKDDKTNYNAEAKKKLTEVERKITVTNFGDINYITGSAVIVKEPYTGLYGKFFIDSDEHNWKNGIYTNKLVLNFKNIMYEKENGELEDNKTATRKKKTGNYSKELANLNNYK